MEEMMLRFGSQALKPHSSSRLKPLNQGSANNHVAPRSFGAGDSALCLPHAKHVDQVLLRQIILLVHIPLQGSKDQFPFRQCPSTICLESSELCIPHARIDVRLGCSTGLSDTEVLELFTENDDGLF